MVASLWHVGLLFAFVATNVLVAYHAYRLQNAGTATAAGTERATLVDPESETVECPDCGEENELGYRFCRSCVSELPAQMPFERADDSPLGRVTR